MNKFIIAVCTAFIIVATGCGGNTKPAKRPTVEDNDSVKQGPTLAYVKDSESSTPVVTVELNGVPIKMLWDTGATGSTISTLEFLNLLKAGNISEDDHLGNTYATVADGSIVEVPIYVIREVIIRTTDGKEKIVNNVTVSVMDNLGASALLGQNVMKELPKYTFDDVESVIRFEE